MAGNLEMGATGDSSSIYTDQRLTSQRRGGGRHTWVGQPARCALGKRLEKVDVSSLSKKRKPFEELEKSEKTKNKIQKKKKKTKKKTSTTTTLV